MLNVSSLLKSFGNQTVLDNISFTLNPGERFGLVGPNGCGKTTLLSILVGQEQPDRGSFHYSPANVRVGYLPQGFIYSPGETIASFLHQKQGDLELASTQVAEKALALAAQPSRLDLKQAYEQALDSLEIASGNTGRVANVMSGLGLDLFDVQNPIASLSGGQKTRLALAGLLLSDPQILLLDEPTNHLDIPMLEWLEDWLVNYSGSILLVSHDRIFLDTTVTGILELNQDTHSLVYYPGNYSDYLEARLAERQRQGRAFSDQQFEIARLRKAASAVRSRTRFHKGGKTDPSKTDGLSAGFFANRSLETFRRAKAIEKRIKHLLTDERIEKPGQIWQMRMVFDRLPESGRDVLVLDKLGVGYGNKVILDDLNITLRYSQRVAFIGPNGCGKTTLLKTLSGQLEPLSGRFRLGSGVRMGYMAQEQENLDPASNALQAIQAVLSVNETEARSFLSYYLFSGDDVFIPAGNLSYGERSRLSLAVLVAQGFNLLLLDEPINHLDIPSRMRFERALETFRGITLAVVHDRYFIQSYASHIWEIVEGSLKVHER